MSTRISNNPRVTIDRISRVHVVRRHWGPVDRRRHLTNRRRLASRSPAQVEHGVDERVDERVEGRERADHIAPAEYVGGHVERRLIRRSDRIAQIVLCVGIRSDCEVRLGVQRER